MDRPEVAGYGENHQSQHELLEEIAHLEQRERVLIGENDDLRRQLVDKKEEETTKFDDLMVEHRQLKDNANRSQRGENGDELVGIVPNDIHIKQEYLDEPSDNEQQMYCDDNPDTNSHNVTVNIKTEPMDCDFVVVKQEIKEEDDEDTSTNTNQVTVKTESIDENVKVEIKEEDDHDDDCDGCVRCLVKKEEVSDDDQVDHDEGELIRGGQHEHDNQVDESSSNQPIDSNEVMNQENGLGDEDEDKTDLGEDDEMPNTTKDNHDGAMVVSSEPSTSSTPRNLTKRKQTQSNQTVKKSKKTVENNDEDIATDDQVEGKIKMISLNCTEENCQVKLNSLDLLHSHLLTIHGLLPYRCFAQKCNARCDNSRQMADHIKHDHSNSTHFVCHVCGNVFPSQKKTRNHWIKYHQTGQFECNLNGCSQVLDTRQKVYSHQQYKHSPESKRFECAHHGCSSSFVFKNDLARHELTHLNTRPFHCTWLHCSHSTNERSNLLRHIRTQHFGLPRSVKEQMEKKMEDHRDPNEYVRVVE